MRFSKFKQEQEQIFLLLSCNIRNITLCRHLDMENVIIHMQSCQIVSKLVLTCKTSRIDYLLLYSHPLFMIFRNITISRWLDIKNMMLEKSLKKGI